MAWAQEKFRGCLVGAMVGDVVGAVVEAESGSYIRKTFSSLEEMLERENVPEFSGPAWRVGRFTDDTQMMLGVAQWLLEDDGQSAERLLARFSENYEPWRRYGSGTEMILKLYREHPKQWRELATAMFPHGSYGNGSAMRVAPVGLAFVDDAKRRAAVAMESSRPTHSHPLAYQGAVIQASAVALAVKEVATPDFVDRLRKELVWFRDAMQDVSRFEQALNAIEKGLRRGATCVEISEKLGTGIEVYEAVPMAVYCFLRHRESYADVVREAVFVGGDTDTIACMAGAIAGAALGRGAIPSAWVEAVKEEKYSVSVVEGIGDRMMERFGS